MYKKLGRFTVSHPWLMCAIWVVAGCILSVLAPSWSSTTQDDDIRFLPSRCASVRGYQLLEESFPRDVFASKAIFAIERPDGTLTKADFTLVDQMVAELGRLKQEEPALQIGNITSYRDGLIGSRLNSADGHCSLIQVSLSTPFLALQTRAAMDKAEARLKPLVEAYGPGAPRLMATGPAGIGRDLIRASADSLEGTTLATLLLVVVVLLLVYRAPLLALIPLLTIAVSVWVSLKLLALMTLIPGVHLVNVAKIFAIVILYGSGTDYCLFLISRYKEELAEGYEIKTALERSVANVGGALAASAGTVICGLGLMGLAEFAKVRCAGPAIALSLGVALLASLTLAPAFLCLMQRFVFWPSKMPTTGTDVLQLRATKRETLWERISRGVIARPVLIWSVAVLVLAPLAILGLRVHPNYKPTGELHPQSPSVRGITAIQRHYTAGEVGPCTVLLASPCDWNSAEGKDLIAHLSRGFGNLPNVVEVRSLTQPLGTPLQAPAPEPAGKGLLSGLLKSVRKDLNRVLENAQQAARDYYVARVPGDKPRYVTRLDVVFHTDPFDNASMQTVEQLQIWMNELLPQTTRRFGKVESECYGVTVCARDLATITESDRVRVNSLVLCGILAILLVLVRRPWLAIYLLVTVLFSYYATLGATALIGMLWSNRPLGQVDWRVPFFLFTILVAVGEDYNIFLVTRVLEEKKRHGEEEGMRRALAHTGGTITSCGLIMAGTFATLMLGGLGTLVQIGFALAFGVLIDTFVVRPFLVPTFTLFVWRLLRKDRAEARKLERREEELEMPRRRRLPRAS
jgi:RND superfamily putative drug exporter